MQRVTASLRLYQECKAERKQAPHSVPSPRFPFPRSSSAPASWRCSAKPPIKKSPRSARGYSSSSSQADQCVRQAVGSAPNLTPGSEVIFDDSHLQRDRHLNGAGQLEILGPVVRTPEAYLASQRRLSLAVSTFARTGRCLTAPTPGGNPMTTTEISPRALSDVDRSSQLRRAVIASTIGTTIEWYDFLLYGFLTALVFAKLYFPQSDPLVGTMQAYAIFFVGF